ncbi:MAG: Rpn family recombination-promoting nuclease/putative transposase [Serratia symbiotica]|nr:Rpn family recombination-promoting nuclease/putative transposase [Serratia symbiotica]
MLKLESGNFFEEYLRAYYSDVLYSLKMGQGTCFIYCLIEHQSSHDKHMAFRLMRYVRLEVAECIILKNVYKTNLPIDCSLAGVRHG